ncbi:hypothetical protein HDU90_003867 [Geranomyces variabilis]|nr:hypothetical protein HDU90_003867 [Geranomyces variabilis]
MPLQRTFLRPSPGEEERLRVEERAKAKLLRLEQVKVIKLTTSQVHLALKEAVSTGQAPGARDRGRTSVPIQFHVSELYNQEKTQQHLRDEIELQRRRLLYTVRESEDHRAMEVARERRLRSLTEAETVEIVSNPTQRVEFLRARAHDGGQFQHTYAHRGQAATATKCDLDPEAAANGKADAWAEAQRAAAKKRQEDAVKARQAERLKEKTAQRSKKAEHDAAMNKQKDLLLRALASLHSRDRQNKVRSVATDACRPPRLKPEELESRFTKIFDIGARRVPANPR